jgi:hypothetical protein
MTKPTTTHQSYTTQRSGKVDFVVFCFLVMKRYPCEVADLTVVVQFALDLGPRRTRRLGVDVSPKDLVLLKGDLSRGNHLGMFLASELTILEAYSP